MIEKDNRICFIWPLYLNGDRSMILQELVLIEKEAKEDEGPEHLQ